MTNEIDDIVSYVLKDADLNQVLLLAFVALAYYFCCESMLDYLLPHLPGLCYSAAFPIGLRLAAVEKYHCNPDWEKWREDKGIDKTYKFNYFHVPPDGRRIHMYQSERGKTVSEWGNSLDGLKCGSTMSSMRPFNWYLTTLRAHQGFRVMLWIFMGVSVAFEPSTWMFVVPSVVLSIYWSTDALGVALACAVGYRAVLEPTVFAGILVIWWLGHQAAAHLNSGIWDVVPRGKSVTPPIGNYPVGIAASRRAHQFMYPNRNNNLIKPLFYDLVEASKDARSAFIDDTGIPDMQSRQSGSPHPAAAVMGRFFCYKLHDWVEWDNYIINIAGTAKGYDARTSGAFIQPPFSDSDAANILKNPSQPGLGRQLIQDYIATDCGPVGSNKPFEPCWGLDGLGGADIVMSHCYDIPIKALLAVADVNNSCSVYVFMHHSPDMFRKKSGRLPWTKQTWTVKGEEFEWKWVTTPGRTWTSNIRVLYEHFCTDYVCTSEGTYYVSDLYRKVLDGVVIRWTRTNSRPIRTKQRGLIVKLPHRETQVPMCQMSANDLGDPELAFFVLFKMFEEYLHSSLTFEDFCTSARALTDNYDKNYNLLQEYVQYDNLVAIWNAELYRRVLVKDACPDQLEVTSLKILLGLKPDPKYTKNLARRLLSKLKESPSGVEYYDTLCQDTPYVVYNDRKPVVTRSYPMIASMPLGTGLLMQEVFDEGYKTVKVIELTGEGNNMSEKLCHVLFGRYRQVGPIFPLGDFARGGSKLMSSGTKLLPTEMEYLIEDLNVAVVVKTATRTVYFSGPTRSTRKIVVKIDIENETATRVNYPVTMSLDNLMSKLDAVKMDLDSNFSWLSRMHGSPRSYVGPPEDDARLPRTQLEYERCQGAEIRRKLQTKVSPIQRTDMMAALETLYPYQTYEIVEGCTAQDVPNLSTSVYYPQYDGYNHIEGFSYPPPHRFSRWSISNMRKLRLHD